METDLVWSCPRCQTGMVAASSTSLRSWDCSTCGFGWVSGEALAAFLPTVKAFEALRTAAIAGPAARRPLSCPLCRVESLHTIKATGVELDVCVKCVGVTLDPGELRVLKSLRSTTVERAVGTLDAAEALATILDMFT